MHTIRQTLAVPAGRRLRLDLSLPDGAPAGKTEMLVVPCRLSGKTRILRQSVALRDALPTA
ncbi:MAG: hypothetical protein LBC94_10325 [Desulfovibrio sp.]|nr:hypothetical protein [Desulfovibrio sp.]